jgi:hypothetical protein
LETVSLVSAPVVGLKARQASGIFLNAPLSRLIFLRISLRGG